MKSHFNVMPEALHRSLILTHQTPSSIHKMHLCIATQTQGELVMVQMCKKCKCAYFRYKTTHFEVRVHPIDLHFVFYTPKSKRSETLMKSEETRDVRSLSWRVCTVEELHSKSSLGERWSASKFIHCLFFLFFFYNLF